MTYLLVVAKEFSPSPAGRLPVHGPDNGQRFRRETLLHRLAEHRRVKVDFSGVEIAIGSSFLNEAIAGLVNHDGWTEAEVRERIELFIPSDRSKEATAWAWVAEAEQARCRREKGASSASSTIAAV